MTEGLDEAFDTLYSMFGKRRMSLRRKQIVKDCVEKYGLDETMTALTIAVEQYYDDEIPESLNDVFKKLGGILYNRKNFPVAPCNTYNHNYLIKIIKNNWDSCTCEDKEVVSYILEKFDVEDPKVFRILKRIFRYSENTKDIINGLKEAINSNEKKQKLKPLDEKYTPLLDVFFE